MMTRHPLAHARRSVSAATERSLERLPDDMHEKIEQRIEELMENASIPTEANCFLEHVLYSEIFTDPAIDRRMMNLAGSAIYRAMFSEDRHILKNARKHGLSPTVALYLFHTRLYAAGRLAGRAEMKAECIRAELADRRRGAIGVVAEDAPK